MNTAIKNYRSDINFDEINKIRLFAEMGAPIRLFTNYWGGAYKGIYLSMNNTLTKYFTTNGGKKVGGISWIKNKETENAAYLIFRLYQTLAPDNKNLKRMITEQELIDITISYNIKFAQDEEISITKVHALLTMLDNCTIDQGIAIYTCSCNNYFISRVSLAPLTCFWCRSNINKRF